MSQIDHKYFPVLDGVRAICILLVIYVHTPLTGPSRYLPGWVGVDIFFVISGFLITTLLFRETRSNGRIDLKAFYIRRFFRIVPLYALVLAFYIVTSLHDPVRWSLLRAALPYYLTFMNDISAVRMDRIGFDGTPFGATWSLGVEEKFYLVWPFVAFTLARSRVTQWATIAVLLAASSFLPERLFRSNFALLLGCLLAMLLSGPQAVRVRTALTRIPVFVICVLMVAGFVLVAWNKQFIFLFSAFSTLLIGMLVIGDNWLVRFLSHRVMVWVGRRSYSMYLIQAVCLGVAERLLRPMRLDHSLAVFFLGVSFAILIAEVLFRFVEEPSRIFGKRLLAQSGHPSSSITPSVVKPVERNEG